MDASLEGLLEESESPGAREVVEFLVCLNEETPAHVFVLKREAAVRGEEATWRRWAEAAGWPLSPRGLGIHPGYPQGAPSILSFCFGHLRLYHMPFPLATQYSYLSFKISF